MTKHIIKRETYLTRIRPFFDDELVKIIVGLRRSGKSVLLRQIMDEIAAGDGTAGRILYYNFESLEYAHISSALELDKDVKAKMSDAGKYYLFFDEIQLIPDFEKAVNSLRATEDVSIFITGSNSSLMSSELSTVLSGRYVAFKTGSFSFIEALDYLELGREDADEFLDDYLRWGALPHRFDLEGEPQLSGYLSDVFDSIIKRDCIERTKIRNTALFSTVLRYMLENVGSLFSLSNVTNYLKSAKRSASNDTIYDYIAAISGALLLQEVQRYNIAGKQILSNVCKHYASDLGIMQIKAAKNKINEGALLENLVYNELIRRQYDVYVGYLEAGEVDFVAIKGGEPTYIQVTTYLSDPKVQQREFGSLLKIMDNWEKLVISKDRTDFSQDGIKHKNIVDWLLEQ